MGQLVIDEIALNYFQLLGLPQTFQLHPADLEAAYQRLSQQWHPDRVAVSSKEERTQILLRAAELNHAYRTLKDDQQRARYLLTLYGIDISQEAGEFGRLDDPEFLMEMLDWQDALKEATTARQADQERALSEEIYERVKATKEAIAQEFSLVERGNREKLPVIVQQVLRLRYYHRLLEQVFAPEEHV